MMIMFRRSWRKPRERPSRSWPSSSRVLRLNWDEKISKNICEHLESILRTFGNLQHTKILAQSTEGLNQRISETTFGETGKTSLKLLVSRQLLLPNDDEKLLIFQNNVAKDDMGHRKENKDFIWSIAHARKPVLNPLIINIKNF